MAEVNVPKSLLQKGVLHDFGASVGLELLTATLGASAADALRRLLQQKQSVGPSGDVSVKKLVRPELLVFHKDIPAGDRVEILQWIGALSAPTKRKLMEHGEEDAEIVREVFRAPREQRDALIQALEGESTMVDKAAAAAAEWLTQPLTSEEKERLDKYLTRAERNTGKKRS
ncbi:MAG: hypothetical protein AAB539_00305 [Patescibacteria group bacterium]